MTTTRVMETKTIFGTEVPLIKEITFIDQVDRYQEMTFVFDNTEGVADREVHIDTLDNTLEVERIDSYATVDAVSRYWETRRYPDNKTIGNNPPPYFITHARTHIKDLGNLDTERIDEITYIDPVDRYQETTFILGPWDDE